MVMSCGGTGANVTVPFGPTGVPPRSVAVIHDVRLLLEHASRGVTAHVALGRGEVVGRPPDAVGVRPQAAPQHRRAACIPAGTVYLREEQCVRQTIRDILKGL